MPITARLAAKPRSVPAAALPANNERRVVYKRRQKKGGAGIMVLAGIAFLVVLLRDTIFPMPAPGHIDRIDENEKSVDTTAMAAGSVQINMQSSMSPRGRIDRIDENEKSLDTTIMAGASVQINLQSSSKISKGRSRQKTTKDLGSSEHVARYDGRNPVIWIWNDAQDLEAFEDLPAAGEAEAMDHGWKRQTPKLGWTVRSLEARRRVARDVTALMNQRQGGTVTSAVTVPSHGSAGREGKRGGRQSAADAANRGRAQDTATAPGISPMLGKCGAEYLLLASANPGTSTCTSTSGAPTVSVATATTQLRRDASDGNESGENGNTADQHERVAMYVLVYDAGQLSMLPGPESDPRYLVVDQTRDASLGLAMHTHDGDGDGANRARVAVRQYLQLLPLRPVLQAQLSEWGAVLAVADVLAAGVGKRRARTPDLPVWVGISPVKRMLEPRLLDGIHLKEDEDRDTVFFWTTCCGSVGVNSVLRMNKHRYPNGAGPDLDQLHLDIARAAFGDGYTDRLPRQAWPLKGGYLMHRSLFLEFACFCRVFAAHFLDRYVTAVRGGGGVDEDNRTRTELVRPELFAKPEDGIKHANTLQRSWGYFLERLLAYWVYNAGYGLTMVRGGHVSGADALQLKELERRDGRWPLLIPVGEGDDRGKGKELGKTHRALRTCSSSLLCSIEEGPADWTETSRRIRCPHLYTDKLE